MLDTPLGLDTPAVAVAGLSKIYASGFRALEAIDLTIRRGEIFALLGPNGAGKTTLIGTICGIVQASAGTIHVAGHDVARDYRAARAMIGLVPQELTTDAFESVWATVSFSRGLFGKAAKPAHVEHVLRQLSLLDKRDSKIMTLSGGMKRRVLIAKALAHEPQILFLDEPTAGVDVELRRDMWRLVRELSDSGVTVILTTHYLEEAEALADRIGVMRRGRLLLVEDKAALMEKLGRRQVIFTLARPAATLPPALAALPVSLAGAGCQLVYTSGARDEPGAIDAVLHALAASGLGVAAVESKTSSLEDIFVELIREPS